MSQLKKLSKCVLLHLALANLLGSSLGLDFRYGQHFPNGAAGVNYIYSTSGTWKPFTPLNYEWNYYEQYATPEHPFDKGALINAANGSKSYTARDANGILLCDPDHDLEINPSYCPPGSASFHEHGGVGSGGVVAGAPFTQFWYDDNYLARIMSTTYLRRPPAGLAPQPEGSFLRWSILEGSNHSHFWPYNSTHFDTLALDGLFYLGTGNLSLALQTWYSSLELSSAIWNSTEGRWNYPGLHENYHVGLWTILTNFLLEHGQISGEQEEELLTHLVSLRRVITENQEVSEESGQLLGWISNIGSDSALINTESVSCNVLGLGAGSKWVFEFSQEELSPGKWALSNDKESLGRTKGPSFPLPGGSYKVGLLFRSRDYAKIVKNSGMGDVVGKFGVVLLTKGTRTVLKEKVLTAAMFKSKDLWSKVEIDIEILHEFKDGVALFDFVVEWDYKLFGQIEFSAVIVK